MANMNRVTYAANAAIAIHHNTLYFSANVYVPDGDSQLAMSRVCISSLVGLERSDQASVRTATPEQQVFSTFYRQYTNFRSLPLCNGSLPSGM